ncbi:hypothetical protein MTO96_004646 [Rhipicephalus appendiculatus]
MFAVHHGATTWPPKSAAACEATLRHAGKRPPRGASSTGRIMGGEAENGPTMKTGSVAAGGKWSRLVATTAPSRDKPALTSAERLFHIVPPPRYAVLAHTMTYAFPS